MEERGIPAASIGSIDLEKLATTDPATAAEIARIDELMTYGKETEEEFVRLVRLLHGAGYSKDAELLMRHWVDSESSQELYRSLFSTAVPDEFRRAIRALTEEFNLELHLRNRFSFLHEVYDSVPADRRTPRYNVLHQPCAITFDFAWQDCVTANVITVEAEQLEIVSAYDLTQEIVLRWKEAKWRLIDWRDA